MVALLSYKFHLCGILASIGKFHLLSLPNFALTSSTKEIPEVVRLKRSCQYKSDQSNSNAPGALLSV